MSDASSGSCRNCGAALHGPYCHACGQKAASLHVDLHHFFHEAMHEFLHLDGKIFRTLKLLVSRPGQLTQEFLDGRRASSISPLRVYLTFSVPFFALAALQPEAARPTVKVTGSAQAEADADKIGETVMHNLPRAMFVLMPAFGLLTWIAYRRQQPFYVPHLYYAVHFHAFVFLLLSAYVLLSLAGRAGKIAGAILFWASVPYHFVALRRVFGGSRWATFGKGTAIGLAYWVLVIAAMLVAAAPALMRL